MVSPLMYLARSDARNATQLDTSSPVPSEPDGILLINIFKVFVYLISHI